ncbi:hypothetical protein OGAPHI_005298 [Ogataea philodendri]|uniref:Uncharacterized protein n=1 Tax=Ogataea philodendri TaxID=1378263 RepID=A0A9P8NZY2_9ASCO|nr:uncharacterized protein OGAPHI_005298 [Ogataea philodendri]KAH3663308.1 hypothetical protein OGAPHI_005298 [Ogataea philodendri]
MYNGTNSPERSLELTMKDIEKSSFLSFTALGSTHVSTVITVESNDDEMNDLRSGEKFRDRRGETVEREAKSLRGEKSLIGENWFLAGERTMLDSSFSGEEATLELSLSKLVLDVCSKVKWLGFSEGSAAFGSSFSSLFGVPKTSYAGLLNDPLLLPLLLKINSSSFGVFNSFGRDCLWRGDLGDPLRGDDPNVASLTSSLTSGDRAGESRNRTRLSLRSGTSMSISETGLTNWSNVRCCF